MSMEITFDIWRCVLSDDAAGAERILSGGTCLRKSLRSGGAEILSVIFVV